MTQLVELREGYAKFVEAGIKLYTISYDDRAALSDFVAAHDIPYPMLSDVDSEVIRAWSLKM